MTDALTQLVLRNVLRRESRSLLQYVSESFPWVTPAERDVLAALHRMIADECRGAAALGRFLVRRNLELPYLGTYPMSFTTVNYVSLDYLLPQLAEHQRAAVAELENDLARVTDPEARGQLEQILVMKQRHLTALEKMASSARPQAVAS
jgi:rubrerythrin